MILPLQMFGHYTVSDQNQMSPVYLFIQILIGFQPNRFVTKYSQKKAMEQIIDYWFILCFGLLPLVLKKINNSSKLFYTLGLLRNSAINENNFL
jgi:hypothetical protein